MYVSCMCVNTLLLTMQQSRHNILDLTPYLPSLTLNSLTMLIQHLNVDYSVYHFSLVKVMSRAFSQAQSRKSQHHVVHAPPLTFCSDPEETVCEKVGEGVREGETDTRPNTDEIEPGKAGPGLGRPPVCVVWVWGPRCRPRHHHASHSTCRPAAPPHRSHGKDSWMTRWRERRGLGGRSNGLCIR
jgi:hypothetical protein